MATIEELREAEWIKQNEFEAEKARLKEKVLCAEVNLPNQLQKHLGIKGFTMKASELEEFIKDEIESRDFNTMTCTIRFMMKTNKWIENLPEADI